MKHRTILSLMSVILLVLAATAMLSTTRPVLGQMTIPTRTPKPDTQPTNPPPEPTSDNGGGGGGGGNNPAPTEPPAQPTEPAAQQPVNTAVPPAPTATEFAVVPPLASPTVVASPTVAPSVTAPPTIGVFATIAAFPGNATPYPTAVPCGIPPTFEVIIATTVFSGPGEAYEPVALLGVGEARPIAGRAAFGPWWVIQLDAAGRSGWVKDADGHVAGNTSRVAIISAPDLNGAQPTPGAAPWVPTPNPDCKVPLAAAVDAANTADAAEPPSNQPVISAESAVPAAIEPIPDQEVQEASSTAAGSEPLDIAGETLARRGTGDVNSEAAQIVADLASTAEPLALSSAPSAPNFMPVLGVVLLIVAVILGVYIRRGSGTSAH